MTIREQIEKREQEILSPYACLSVNSKGRQKEEPQCDIRPVFQRDRDRIIHCKAFRRLKHKTQVFLAPEGDHYRTRLTHTLEVSQNARTIAKALRLNEDLVEAIALGHDLGHVPFGHTGESILNKISLENNEDIFKQECFNPETTKILNKNAFVEMSRAARKENLKIIAMSSYRSYKYQVELYNRYVSEDGKDAADTYSARPGFSEHQTALAVDIHKDFKGISIQNIADILLQMGTMTTGASVRTPRYVQRQRHLIRNLGKDYVIIVESYHFA